MGGGVGYCGLRERVGEVVTLERVGGLGIRRFGGMWLGEVVRAGWLGNWGRGFVTVCERLVWVGGGGGVSQCYNGSEVNVDE